MRGPKRLEYAEFQHIPYDGLGHHLFKGMHIITPAPSSRHQWISSKLSRILGNFVEDSEIGEVLVAPYDIKLSEDSGFQPDIVLIHRRDFKSIKESHFEGIPLLVIEILSPGSHKEDYVWKRLLSEEFGVPEYWVVNLEDLLVDVFNLKDRHYSSRTIRKGEILSSTLVDLRGLTIDTQKLFDSMAELH